jgi:3-methyladenine DNA glycosylase AlkD
MTLDEALAALESAGTEQTRKIYRRHGFADPMYGVSYAALGKLKKQIKRDQQLAEALWKTRNHDAQVLATMVADPAEFDAVLAHSWADSAVDYGTQDALAKDVVSHTPHAQELAEQWVASSDDLLNRAGWSTVGSLATLGDDDIPNAWFTEFFEPIAAQIHSSSNRVKEGMNSALIAIGSRNDALRGPATEAARRIGKVTVDHGETNCKTPDAVSYIEKTHTRRAARASA